MTTPAELLTVHRAVLARRFPDVLARLDREGDSPGVEALVARSGDPTVVVTGEDGSSRLIHSRYDPASEAHTLVEALDVPDGGTVVCIGGGLWYHIEEILRNHPDTARILVIEPDPRILRQALALRDIGGLLDNPKVLLSCADDEAGVSAFLLSLGSVILHNGLRLVVLPSAEQAAPGMYRRVRDAVLASVRVMEISVRTNMANVLAFHANVLENLPAIVSSPGIATLQGFFAERPAICVNAGPSLNKNIDDLVAAQGRALIIAVDVVLHRLLSKGIVPDVVVSIDFQACHYQDTFSGEEEHTREPFLVFDPELCPEIVRTWRGGRFFFSVRKPMGRWINAAMGDPGSLEKGGCVGHAAFYLAEYLRCNPIILVGQDFSYPGITHAEGVRVRQDIAVGDGSDGRKYLLKRREDGTWLAGELFMVKDIHGGEVPTDHQMFTYLRQLERAIALSDRTVIDATEGGALISGTRLATLRDAIATHCCAPGDAKAILAGRVAAHQAGACARAMQRALDEMLILLRQAGSLAQDGDRLIAQVRKRIAGASVPDRHTERMMRDAEEIKNRLQALPLWFREIAEYQMNANVWLLNAASVRSLSKLNVRQRIAELSTRFELYFKGYIAVCDDLVPRCEAAKGALSSIR